MTPPAPLTYDPVLRHVFQPIVDRTRLDPRKAAVAAADVFLALAVTLAAVRVATIDRTMRPDLHVWQLQHVVGATMVYGWMRFCIAIRPFGHLGAMGVLHAAFRVVMLGCLVLDLREVSILITTDLPVPTASLMRSAMQLAETTAAVLTLYLQMCRTPPPRRPKVRRAAPSLAA